MARLAVASSPPGVNVPTETLSTVLRRTVPPRFTCYVSIALIG